MNTTQSIERNFGDLFLDSAKLVMKAEQEANCDTDFAFSLARASLLSAFCLIEACANICLESLGIAGPLADDIDRMPILSKFDLYLRLKFKNKKLDRGSFPVQGAQELKKIRDTFVHPKAYRTVWQVESDRIETLEIPRTKILNISKLPSEISPEEAIISIQATHRFLNYFFRDICGFSPSTVSHLLFSEEHIVPSSRISFICLEDDIKAWFLDHKIPIEYMRLG
jgi:hypothetical protein